MSLSSAQPLQQLIAGESAAHLEALRQGETVITGQAGQYTAQVMVAASPETAWEVLTDYENFADFLPTVTASQVLQDQGDRKVVEQIDRRQVLLAHVESRLCTENYENLDLLRIDFRLLEGDLKHLQGYWQVDAIATEAGFAQASESEAVLVTQAIAAEAGVGLLDGAFYGLLESSLQENLQAIKHEAERRP
jgi:ribosome-associated toxin RatA of RatAB toxin-antitoxin module